MNELTFKNPKTGNKIRMIRGTFQELKDLEKQTGVDIFGQSVDVADKDGFVTLRRNDDETWTINDHWDFEETGPIGIVLEKAVRAKLIPENSEVIREWVYVDGEYWQLEYESRIEQRLSEIIKAHMRIPGWVELHCEVKYKGG